MSGTGYRTERYRLSPEPQGMDATWERVDPAYGFIGYGEGEDEELDMVQLRQRLREEGWTAPAGAQGEDGTLQEVGEGAVQEDSALQEGEEGYSQVDLSASSISLPSCSSSSNHSAPHYQLVMELGPEEVRWFYWENKKTWMPFIGYDSLRIELTFRHLWDLRELGQEGAEGQATCNPSLLELVCVRGGLYEVDVAEGECYPLYWNQSDKTPILRGQWFVDGTWQPLSEEESDLIEIEHLSRFRGQHAQDTALDLEPSPPYGKACVLHTLKLSHSHVDWHSLDEVYLYSDATTSKFARKVTQKLGFSKASSSGTRLHRGYVEEATLDDKPPQTTHIVFVVHGIGQKMDQGRIIKNTAMMRDNARKVEERHFSNHDNEHVEFLPVEWRSKLALDGDTVHSITPDKVPNIRNVLNSSAMDIMYYTSPLYRDELVKGLQQELNRLYTLFCSRNPEFDKRGGKVSIVSHSLGCVITYDIMTGWNPMKIYEQFIPNSDREGHWASYEEQYLIQELHSTKQRWRQLEQRLHELKTSTICEVPALKFKVEYLFCMGSPLAVFLALRGVRPGNHGSQDHILPKRICNRLFNIFHPTDPVAYRLEPLILKKYTTIAPVQIHWYNTTHPIPYNLMKPCFLKPSKQTTLIPEIESITSPSMSPAMAGWHSGESERNIDKKSGAALKKGIGGMFSGLAHSSKSTVQTSDTANDGSDVEVKKSDLYRSSNGKQSFTPGSSVFLDTTLELQHRIDFELREGLVENRYWSAVTSHTAYWSSMDVALFFLTFLYKQNFVGDDGQNSDPH